MGDESLEKVDRSIDLISTIIKNLELNVTVSNILERSMTKININGDLIALDLSELGITELLDNSIPEIETLKNLNLMSNRIEKINEGFLTKLRNLRILSLHNCGIKEIPDQFFSKSKFLESIVLSKNQLVALPRSISSLNELQDLRVSNNQITEIDDNMFTTLPNLKLLDLQDNKIVKLPDNLVTFIRLEQLKLEGNTDLGLYSANYETKNKIMSFMSSYVETLDPEVAEKLKTRIERKKLEIDLSTPEIHQNIVDISMIRTIIYFLCIMNTLLLVFSFTSIEGVIMWLLLGLILIPFTIVATFGKYGIPLTYAYFMVFYFLSNFFNFFILIRSDWWIDRSIFWLPLLPFLFLLLNYYKINRPMADLKIDDPAEPEDKLLHSEATVLHTVCPNCRRNK